MWHCRDFAAAAGLPAAGDYDVWLGGPIVPVVSLHEVPGPGWLSTCDGLPLGAGDASELHLVDPSRLCDEHGKPPPGAPGLSRAGGRGHWAGASLDGTATDGGTCGGWLDPTRLGQAGSVDDPGSSWLSLLSIPCTVPLSLLCVGQ